MHFSNKYTFLQIHIYHIKTHILLVTSLSLVPFSFNGREICGSAMWFVWVCRYFGISIISNTDESLINLNWTEPTFSSNRFSSVQITVQICISGGSIQTHMIWPSSIQYLSYTTWQEATEHTHTSPHTLHRSPNINKWRISLAATIQRTPPMTPTCQPRRPQRRLPTSRLLWGTRRPALGPRCSSSASSLEAPSHKASCQTGSQLHSLPCLHSKYSTPGTRVEEYYCIESHVIMGIIIVLRFSDPLNIRILNSYFCNYI